MALNSRNRIAETGRIVENVIYEVHWLPGRVVVVDVCVYERWMVEAKVLFGQ